MEKHDLSRPRRHLTGAGGDSRRRAAWRHGWAAALSLAILSCNASCSQDAMDGQTQPEYREYRRNPDPRRTYLLEARIGNAPGGFGQVSGRMQFNVGNPDCLPPPGSNPGGHTSPVPMRMVPFELASAGEGRYEGVVFTDGMLDEDYHGRGVCRWELANVQLRLQATGAERETLFMADLAGTSVAAGDEEVLFYLRRSYPRSPDTTLDRPASSGQRDRSRIDPAIADDELFTVSLVARERSP